MMKEMVKKENYFQLELERFMSDMSNIITEQIGRKFIINHWYNGKKNCNLY